MKILVTILLFLLSSPVFADNKNKSKHKKKSFDQEAFDHWVDEQYTLIENPIDLVCTYAATHLYLKCATKLRSKFSRGKRGEYLNEVEQICKALYEASHHACIVELEDLRDSGSDDSGSGDNSGDEGGGNSGSGGDGSQNPDGSTTPPDTDPSDDETNNPPTDPNQPPIL